MHARALFLASALLGAIPQSGARGQNAAPDQNGAREAQILAFIYKDGVTAEGKHRPAVLAFAPQAIAADPSRHADLLLRLQSLGVRVVNAAWSPIGDTVIVRVSRPERDATDMFSFAAEKAWQSSGTLRKLRMIVNAQCSLTRCLMVRELPF